MDEREYNQIIAELEAMERQAVETGQCPYCGVELELMVDGLLCGICCHVAVLATLCPANGECEVKND